MNIRIEHLFNLLIIALKHLVLPFPILVLLSNCIAHKYPQNADVAAQKDYASQTFQTQQQYHKARQQLLAKDSLQAFDASVQLTGEEQVLNQKLLALRQQMMAFYDSIHFFPPTHYFYKWQDHMYNTKLFQVLKAMPKGAVHHLHPSAGIDFHWMVARALQEPNCYAYWHAEDSTHSQGELHFFKSEVVPEGFYLVKALNDSIPNFPDKLYDLLTFDASIGHDSVDIWGEFEKCFNRIGGFATYQPVFTDFYTACFEGLAADGIQHAELRAFLGGSLYDLEHPPGSFGYDSMIRYFQQAAQKVSTQRHQPFTFNLIYTNLRFLPEKVIEQDLEKAYAIKARYPDLVKGYDLVAEENAGHATEYFLNAWLKRDSLSKVYQVDLPLCLHDGESNWGHVTNVYDALLLHSTRVGHGFNLSFFPIVENAFRENETCIEVSPLSNQVLGFVGDLRMHPAHAWINRGLQISISSDDPGIFGYVGVTPDYWAVFLAWELDLRALKKLCMNSILYSLLDNPEKEQAMRLWNQRWEAFVRQANDLL